MRRLYRLRRQGAKWWYRRLTFRRRGEMGDRIRQLITALLLAWGLTIALLSLLGHLEPVSGADELVPHYVFLPLVLRGF